MKRRGLDSHGGPSRSPTGRRANPPFCDQPGLRDGSAVQVTTGKMHHFTAERPLPRPRPAGQPLDSRLRDAEWLTTSGPSCRRLTGTRAVAQCPSLSGRPPPPGRRANDSESEPEAYWPPWRPPWGPRRPPGLLAAGAAAVAAAMIQLFYCQSRLRTQSPPGRAAWRPHCRAQLTDSAQWSLGPTCRQSQSHWHCHCRQAAPVPPMRCHGLRVGPPTGYHGLRLGRRER